MPYHESEGSFQKREYCHGTKYIRLSQKLLQMRSGRLVHGDSFHLRRLPAPQGYDPSRKHLPLDVSYLRVRRPLLSSGPPPPQKTSLGKRDGVYEPDILSAICRRKAAGKPKILPLGLWTQPLEHRQGHPSGLRPLLVRRGTALRAPTVLRILQRSKPAALMTRQSLSPASSMSPEPMSSMFTVRLFCLASSDSFNMNSFTSFECLICCRTSWGWVVSPV